LFAYAHLAMRHAKFDQALETLNKVLEIKPGWSKVVILKSRILAMQNSEEAALAYLEKEMQGESGEDIEIALTYARMLTEARQFEKALDQFVTLSQREPRMAELHYFAGVLALQLKKTDLAREHLKTVLDLGTQRVLEARYYLGQVAELEDKMGEAIDRYASVRRGDLYFNAQVRVVALLSEEDQFERARDHIHSIRVSNDKQQLQLFLLEGDVLREARRYQDAKQFYTSILDSYPGETSIRYARALIAEKLGELDLAEKDLLAIIKAEPDNAQALNALGYTLADRTDRYQEALGYIKKAFELEPEDAAVMDSMGWVKYRLGDYDEAIRHLRRANELAKDPEIAAHLGEVLWVSGNKNGALEIWEQSLEENPDHEILLRVMKRFGL
jgi:tetratricopeptide (TPR) repeat protein